MGAVTTFSLTGRISGKRQTITWTSGQGFLDPTGRTAGLIADGHELEATPTGPFYTASDKAAIPALLTALTVFDRPRDVLQEGTDETWAELQKLCAVPDYATA